MAGISFHILGEQNMKEMAKNITRYLLHASFCHRWLGTSG